MNLKGRQGERMLISQHALNVKPGPDYTEDSPGVQVKGVPAARVVAFYLPQFHPIAENDAWWGEGFTEWTNVTKAIPRFAGHYQPRLPGALGFYDLRNAGSMERQADLARRYGIHGFCFHHYWFAGRRLLQKPLEVLLSHPEIDLPFFVNWANENWTRRWDGHDREVLLGQKHSPEDDIAFARSLEPLFRDPRYMRVNGRPMLMLYRPGILPDAAATVARWRDHFVSAGLGNPYLMMAEGFNDGDPAKYGMDAVVGFPPLWTASNLPRLQNALQIFDPEFRGEVVDYASLAEATVASYAAPKNLLPGLCPGWDNEARRPGRGFSVTGSTPARYGYWLDAACRVAMTREEPDERLVFINAWNEWAEGAYLEPDRHFGHAYLAETARVLNGLSGTTDSRIAGSRQGGSGPVSRPSLSLLRRIARRGALKVAGVAESAAYRLQK